MMIEDYLHKIDTAFKGKTKKEIYMIFIIVVSLIFSFSYLLFWESSQEDFKDKIHEINILNSEIASYETYIQNNPQSKITKLENDTKQLQDKLIEYKDNNEYIREKLKIISSHIYNEDSWGKYLDSISENAQIYDIKIINFSNKNVSSNVSFGHILDITIRCEGKYTNMLKLMNSLEQSDLVVDLHTVKFDVKESLVADLNISVWGIIE